MLARPACINLFLNLDFCRQKFSALKVSIALVFKLVIFPERKLAYFFIKSLVLHAKPYFNLESCVILLKQTYSRDLYSTYSELPAKRLLCKRSSGKTEERKEQIKRAQEAAEIASQFQD